MFRPERRYTRSDNRGYFPKVADPEPLETNRLGLVWRPLIDLGRSEFAPSRLQMFAQVSSWLADPSGEQWEWFARIGVPGLRRQVLRHAGLDDFDCLEPRDLPAELRTPEWDLLARRIDEYPDASNYLRMLVVYQATQLSFCSFAVRLAGPVEASGDPSNDLLVYEVARATARLPGRSGDALTLFDQIVAHSDDPVLVTAACAQGISHSVRGSHGLDWAETWMAAVPAPVDTWAGALARSRYHRAVALIQVTRGDWAAMTEHMRSANAYDEYVQAGATNPAQRATAVENHRILVESEIKAVCRKRLGETDESVRAKIDALMEIDPNCVLARSVAGDGMAALGQFREAARWYEKAGELGTGAGAVAWYRAGQVYDHMGERGLAANAMGRVLELDATAVEPREYLGALSGLPKTAAAAAGTN